jgi:hypothetical protein
MGEHDRSAETERDPCPADDPLLRSPRGERMAETAVIRVITSVTEVYEQTI